MRGTRRIIHSPTPSSALPIQEEKKTPVPRIKAWAGGEGGEGDEKGGGGRIQEEKKTPVPRIKAWVGGGGRKGGGTGA